MTAFNPIGDDSILILLPEQLIQFQPSTRTSITLQAASESRIGAYNRIFPSCKGGLWITGTYGAAKLHVKDSTQWSDFPLPVGMEQLQHPVEGQKADLYAVAFSIYDQQRVLVHLSDSEWRIRYSEDEHLFRGWAGMDGNVWIELREDDQSTLMQTDHGQMQVEEKNAVLAGILFDVLPIEGGAFWISTSAGLARYSPPLWRTPPAIQHIRPRIYAIKEDQKGRVWFLGQNVLILFHEDKWKTFALPERYRTSVSYTQGLAPLPDGRIVIALPYSKRILVFHPETEKFDTIENSSGREISHLCPRQDGTIWLSATQQDDTNVIYRLNYRDTFFLELYDGQIFKTVFSQSWQSLGTIRYLLECSNGELWFGGTGHPGLARYNKDHTFQIIGHNEAYEGSGVFCLHELPNGHILVGDRNQLFECNGESFICLRSGLDRVNSIITDNNGAIWVASGTGLHRLENQSWVTYTADDGLPVSFIYNVYQDSKDNIWAGTANGLSLFHPGSDLDPPQTFIRDKENLMETPPGGNVRIVFSGMDKWKQTHQSRLLYSSRLDGKEWAPFRPRQVAVFNGLPSGSHTFEVKAMDLNLNIDPSPAMISFTVLQHWYQVPFFLILASSGTILILVLIGLVAQRHILLERRVKERTSDLSKANRQLTFELSERKRLEKEILEIRDREQQRIGQDLHDGLIQHLTGIEYISKWLEKQMKTVARPEMEYAGEISREIHNAIQETEEIAKGLNPVVLETDGLVEALHELSVRTKRFFDIDCRFTGKAPENLVTNQTTTFHLYRIAQECINNAVKHGHANWIEMTLDSVEDKLTLTVTDNGEGFPPESKQRRGTGLRIMRYRAGLIGADLRILNRQEGGVQIECALHRETIRTEKQ